MLLAGVAIFKPIRHVSFLGELGVDDQGVADHGDTADGPDDHDRADEHPLQGQAAAAAAGAAGTQ